MGAGKSKALDSSSSSSAAAAAAAAANSVKRAQPPIATALATPVVPASQPISSATSSLKGASSSSSSSGSRSGAATMPSGVVGLKRPGESGLGTDDSLSENRDTSTSIASTGSALNLPDPKLMAAFAAVHKNYRDNLAATAGPLLNKPRDSPERPLPRSRSAVGDANVADPSGTLGLLTPKQLRAFFDRKRSSPSTFDLEAEAVLLGIPRSELEKIVRWTNTYVMVPIDRQTTEGYWHTPILSAEQEKLMAAVKGKSGSVSV